MSLYLTKEQTERLRADGPDVYLPSALIEGFTRAFAENNGLSCRDAREWRDAFALCFALLAGAVPQPVTEPEPPDGMVWKKLDLSELMHLIANRTPPLGPSAGLPVVYARCPCGAQTVGYGTPSPLCDQCEGRKIEAAEYADGQGDADL